MIEMDRSSPLKIKGYEDCCPICYEYWSAVETAPWVLGCAHMICEKCYLKQRLVNKLCPICREKYNLSLKKKSKRKRRYNGYNGSSSESTESWNGWNGWDS